MPYNLFFGQNHRLLVVDPFWANWGKIYGPEGTSGRVLEGQNLYGYVTVKFQLGRRKITERTVVTDYSNYVDDSDYLDLMGDVTNLIKALPMSDVLCSVKPCPVMPAWRDSVLM